MDFGLKGRDGNPCNSRNYLKTAKRLKFSILRNYYKICEPQEKITFPGLEGRIEALEELVFNELFYPKRNKLFSINYITSELEFVLDELTKYHDNLYRNEVLDLIHKLRLFGLHFASLDIRQIQNSS